MSIAAPGALSTALKLPRTGCRRRQSRPSGPDRPCGRAEDDTVARLVGGHRGAERVDGATAAGVVEPFEHPAHEPKHEPATPSPLRVAEPSPNGCRNPGDGPVLEFEQLVKIHFADSGTKADVIANLEATQAWVLEQNKENLAAARAYLAGEGPFPQRAALNQLPGRFLTEFYVTVARWVEWASAIVDTWPDDVNNSPFDKAAAEEGVALAESVESILSARAAQS